MDCQILIYQYPEVMASAIAGIKDLFTIANRFAEGVSFEVWAEGDSEATPDIVILPPCIGDGLPDFDVPEIIAELQSFQAGHACMVANCAAVFWLAQAGILNGKCVTTHWALHDELKSRYPQIERVDRSQMVVDQSNVITAGGVYAYQDLVLHIIARYGGYRLAKAVADFTMLDISGRLQNYYTRFQPNYQHGDARVLHAQEYCNKHRLAEISVKNMAEAANLSERMLARRFNKALGLSPGQYLLQLKIEHARQALESSARSIEQIAEELGYYDLSNFVRAFKRIAGVSPAEFRGRGRG